MESDKTLAANDKSLKSQWLKNGGLEANARSYMDIGRPACMDTFQGEKEANATRMQTQNLHLLATPTRPRSQTANSADMYWRHVETPCFTELAQRTSEALQPAAEFVDRRGKRVIEHPSTNDIGNNRKRSFGGSPDPEDTSRWQRRPRLAGTTPLLRTQARLPISDANPWESTRRNGRTGVRDRPIAATITNATSYCSCTCHSGSRNSSSREYFWAATDSARCLQHASSSGPNVDAKLGSEPPP